MSIDDIRRELGIPSESEHPHFPFFNSHYDVIGNRDVWAIEGYDPEMSDEDAEKLNLKPLRPHWHQWVGLAAMVRRGYDGQERHTGRRGRRRQDD